LKEKEEEIKRLQDKHDEKDDHINRRQAEIEKLTQEKSEVHERSKGWEEEAADHDKKVKALFAKLTRREDEILQIKAEKEEAVRAQAQLNEAIDRLRAEVKEKEQQLTKEK